MSDPGAVTNQWMLIGAGNTSWVVANAPRIWSGQEVRQVLVRFDDSKISKNLIRGLAIAEASANLLATEISTQILQTGCPLIGDVLAFAK